MATNTGRIVTPDGLRKASPELELGTSNQTEPVAQQPSVQNPVQEVYVPIYKRRSTSLPALAVAGIILLIVGSFLFPRLLLGGFIQREGERLIINIPTNVKLPGVGPKEECPEGFPEFLFNNKGIIIKPLPAMETDKEVKVCAKKETLLQFLTEDFTLDGKPTTGLKALAEYYAAQAGDISLTDQFSKILSNLREACETYSETGECINPMPGLAWVVLPGLTGSSNAQDTSSSEPGDQSSSSNSSGEMGVGGGDYIGPDSGGGVNPNADTQQNDEPTPFQPEEEVRVPQPPPDASANQNSPVALAPDEAETFNKIAQVMGEEYALKAIEREGDCNNVFEVIDINDLINMTEVGDLIKDLDPTGLTVISHDKGYIARSQYKDADGYTF